MSKPLLIKDVTTLKAFEPAIKLQPLSADLSNPYFRDYILTQDLADVYQGILSSILGDGWGSTASTLPAERRRSHLITAQYGAGKSYFLMVLSALLDAGGDTFRLQAAREKFERFPEMRRSLGQLTDKRFLIVQVSAEDKGDIRFKELLVRGLLEQVALVLPDAVFANEYTAAISHLEEVESSPIGPAFAQVLSEQFETSLQQLRARLGNYDRDGLRIYYHACERAIGRKVSRDVLDVETTFQEALELLKPKGYTHIAVLIDELTAYLSASARYHLLAETLGELQSFGAYCNKPTSRCLFVGAMHVSVQEFLQDRSLQRDYDKMMGRFDERFFPLYSSRLLADVFRPNEAAFEQAMRSYRGQVKELTDLIAALRMVDDGQPMKLSSFFPLHPAVARYLPFISRELGQAERTTFGFISDVVRPKLDEPLTRGDRLNLVTLDQVFDYFFSAREQREYYQQIVAAHNVVQSKVTDPLALRAFKPLALLLVVNRVRLAPGETPPGLELSSQQVADYLDVEDEVAVENALQSLRETGYVYFDPSTKKYFYSHGDPGWDLENQIQKRMAEVNADEVLRGELQAHGSRVCLNAPASVLVKVDRRVESQSMDIRQLEEASSIKPRNADGKVVFLVPDFADMERYNAVFSDVTQKARDLSAGNVAVAVPEKVDMLNCADLRRYRALQEIGKRLEVGGLTGVDDHRVRITRAKLSEVQGRVQRAVEAFGQASNFIFFVNRQPQRTQDLDAVLVDMFERYYHKFPKVRAERIGGRNTTNALIETCIVNPQHTFASDTSEVARQARDTLQVLGLCVWKSAAGGKYEVELAEPKQGSEGYEIWKIVLDTLTGDSDTPLATLYDRLSKAPYGLPDYMVELYIAAAASRAIRKVYVFNKKTGSMLTAVGKKDVAEITKSKDKDYKIEPVQKTKVPYTYICSIWKAIDEPMSLRYYQELEKSLSRAVDDQRTWLALKQDSNNLLLNQLGRVRDGLSAMEAKSTAFATLVKHLEQARRIVIPAQGFGQLAALGEELSGVPVIANPDTAALAVRRAIEAGQQFLNDWAMLQLVYQLYRQLQQAASLDRLGAPAQDVEDAWQAYRSDALALEKRQAFVGQFDKLWGQYAERYVGEHNTVAKARANYGREIEQSLAYEMLGEFGPFGFEGIATRTSFDDRIRAVREQGCQPLAEDVMRDYRQFGKAMCSSCRYRLGQDIEILRQLREGETDLVTSVDNALDSYLSRLAAALGSESAQVYTREKASAEEKATIASLQELIGKSRPLGKAQYSKLKALLTPLKTILRQAEEYAREQAKQRKELEERLAEEERQKRIPRLPTARLGDDVRSFLLASGLEAMTLKELEERLRNWLHRIAGEFTPPA